MLVHGQNDVFKELYTARTSEPTYPSHTFQTSAAVHACFRCACLEGHVPPKILVSEICRSSWTPVARRSARALSRLGYLQLLKRQAFEDGMVQTLIVATGIVQDVFGLARVFAKLALLCSWAGVRQGLYRRP